MFFLDQLVLRHYTLAIPIRLNTALVLGENVEAVLLHLHNSSPVQLHIPVPLDPFRLQPSVRCCFLNCILRSSFVVAFWQSMMN